MASPHVAGLAAYLIALEGLSGTDAVVGRIRDLARSTGAQVKNNQAGTTNLIANNGNRPSLGDSGFHIIQDERQLPNHNIVFPPREEVLNPGLGAVLSA
ncbi:hypothetical protein VTK73DRAFT_9460 [Phialemonium thermophilum]|uniref:Peptidase S8/S53 domain-containing protein n=1 Tax=Phialemonium thermophilum TaxID=223376 RepID=A0ABR3W222_9PEZI